MPLTLVTGPANSAKAAVVLDGVRAAVDAEPLLVVPTADDAIRLRRELAGDGAVLGVRVVRFAGLLEEVAARAGVSARPLGPLARERVLRSVVARADLRVLAASAATPGFAPAAGRLFAELEVARVDPRRLAAGLRAWAGDDAGRGAYGEELARLYGGWRGALERLGRPDPELRAVAALDALRLAPGAWGATPVWWYGFDDLTPLQRDAVETLARCAEVTVALAYEAGRVAFAGRAATFEELRPLADRVVALPARAEHYAAASRDALHGLERGLFEPEGAPGGTLAPGTAVAVLEAGGERAEAELVAAEVAGLVAGGVPPEEIAVVVRLPEETGPLLARVLAEAGVPVALRRRVGFGHTAAGRGLLGLLRCALLGGATADLLAWLRAPGVRREAGWVDALEARARRQGLEDAAALLAAAGQDEPSELARLRAAAAEGPSALCARLGRELGRALGADGGEVTRAEAQAVAAGRRALDELGALALSAPRLAPDAAALAETLAALEVVIGDEPGPGRVEVCDPLAIRAHRVRALVVAGLQEGAWPRAPRGDAFLGDDDRRDLARAAGIVLPRVEDGGLGAERYLLYATLSRPEERLVLAVRTADDEGDPAVPSSFLDDVRDLFGPELWRERVRRPLGAVRWEGASPPGTRAALRAAGAALPGRPPTSIPPLRTAPVLRALRERPAWSASGLEAWAACPVRWFVERRLELPELEPEPEPMARGRLAHDVLERTLSGLRADTGSARLTPDRLGEALPRMRSELAGAAVRAPIAADPDRQRVALHRLEADLERLLEATAHDGSRLEPTHFEVGFGFDDEGSLPAFEITAPDGPLRLRGRIDRVDVDPATGEGVIVDYKGRKATPGARWTGDRSFQAALYLRAAERLLGLRGAGAFYQPVGVADLRRRGLMVDDADPDLDVVATDRRPAAEVGAVLDEVLALAGRAAAEARAGGLEPRPDTCTPSGACAYPGLCRCDG